MDKRRIGLAVLGGLGAMAAGALVDRALADGIPDTPATLYYSGYLEDSVGPFSGSPLMQVSIFAGASGGSALCATAASPVPVDQGHFRIPLPAACVDAVRANPNLWVEAQIGSEPPLPRQHLGAVPYAVEAEHALSADTATTAATAASAGALTAPRRLVATSTTYTGRIADGALVGYPAARAICQRELGSPTGHMCYGSELARLEQAGVSIPAAVYIPEFQDVDSGAGGVVVDQGDCGRFTVGTEGCGGMVSCRALRWHDFPIGCGGTFRLLCCD